jgi:hypothetical protein
VAIGWCSGATRNLQTWLKSYVDVHVIHVFPSSVLLGHLHGRRLDLPSDGSLAPSLPHLSTHLTLHALQNHQRHSYCDVCSCACSCSSSVQEQRLPSRAQLARLRYSACVDQAQCVQRWLSSSFGRGACLVPWVALVLATGGAGFLGISTASADEKFLDFRGRMLEIWYGLVTTSPSWLFTAPLSCSHL